ncbi:MAG TPA: class I SAM-dependent methyltransferase [Candidatus Limnocylindrales bacterium]|nr:class I SAM-dependent methyltransferase [Candidatus Limnocylindrales bacterium]
MELVEGADRVPPGRAIDLGCGTGRNALYLARHGWQAIGVEMVQYAVHVARQRAQTEGLAARFLVGDVTRLSEVDIDGPFDLLVDGGCYHMIPPARRDAYADSVTEAAAPGARLVMVGFSRAFGMDRDELMARMPQWRLTDAGPVPAEQMYQYVSGPAPLKAALKRSWFHPVRYELVAL